MSLTGITVLYDETCALCRRSAHWLETEKAHIPIDVLAAGSPAAKARFGDIEVLGEDLVVVGDDGRVWWGSPDAFIMAMWALRKWRPWAIRLESSRDEPTGRGRLQASLHPPQSDWGHTG